MSRLLLLCCVVIMVGVSAYGLFKIKHEVQNQKKDLVEIRRQLANDYRVIHMLEAEWAYVNNPERIKKLAKRHLGLQHYTLARQIKDDEAINYAYFHYGDIQQSHNVTPTLRPILSGARRIR